MDWALWFLIGCLAVTLVVVVVLPLRSWLEYRREHRRRLFRYFMEEAPKDWAVESRLERELRAKLGGNK
jgi:hypothetical protein